MKRLPYRDYLLILLTAISALNFTDRIALGLALQSIKSDLHLNDAQLGFLTGLAFSVFYATAGIPIGRWADRGNRVTIVSLTTFVWSILIALSGRAVTFLQLLLARVGVGVGESGCIPTAYSLISDAFSRAERPRALGIYALGGSASFVVGYFWAGWINQIYGWRDMFMVIGAPGLLVAVLAAMTLREPRLRSGLVRRIAAFFPVRSSSQVQALLPRLWPTVQALYANAAYRNLLLALTANYLFGWGIVQWQPAFFIRSYGLRTGYLGTWLAFSLGISGMLGSYLGGHLASRHAQNNEPLQLRVVTALNVAYGAIYTYVYLSRNYYVSFALIGFAHALAALGNGPLFAAMQAVVPERVRGTSISIVFLCANLIGGGLGPLLVGVLSDFLHPLLGTESLRYALVAMGPGYFWGAWHLWRASKFVQVEIDTVSRQSAVQPPFAAEMLE